jgi:uncharacterized protein (TIRG00374 family)
VTKKTVALLVFGTILLVLFLRRIPFVEAAARLREVPSGPLLLIIASNALTPLLKALRWRALLRGEGERIRFSTLFSSVSAGFFLGLVTPGTSGEFGRVMTLKVDRVAGLATVLFEKVWDLAILALIVITAGLSLRLRGTALYLAAPAVWIVSALIVVGIARRPKIASAIPRLIVRRLLSQERGDRVAAVWQHVVALLRSPRLTIISALFSLLLWIIPGLQYGAILRTLGVTVTLPLILVSFFVPYLAGVVLLVPLGIGVFDLGTAHLATGMFGVPDAEATASVLLYRILITLVLVLWGFACYVHRLHRREPSAAHAQEAGAAREESG